MKRSKTVNTGTYEFHYAPLDEVFESVRPALAANGLAITQIVESANGEELRLRTLLIHESGAMLESMLPLWVAPDSKAQALGSAITYMRRYALQAILGVAAEEDDDGAAGAGLPREVSNRAGTAPVACPKCGTVGSLKKNKGVWQCWKSLGGCEASFSEDPATAKDARLGKPTTPKLNPSPPPATNEGPAGPPAAPPAVAGGGDSTPPAPAGSPSPDRPGAAPAPEETIEAKIRRLLDKNDTAGALPLIRSLPGDKRQAWTEPYRAAEARRKAGTP